MKFEYMKLCLHGVIFDIDGEMLTFDIDGG